MIKGHHTRDRLAAFKAGTAPYGQTPPVVERAVDHAAYQRELRQHNAEHRKHTARLRKAARALPSVYGEPPGTDAVKAAVRRAKGLVREMMPMAALEACVGSGDECALVDVIEAVLAMRGA